MRVERRAHTGAVAAYLLDRTESIVGWSAEAERVKGYAGPEAIGRSFQLFYAPEDRRDAVPEEHLLAAVEGDPRREGWRVRRDGTRFWAKSILVPLHGVRREVSGFIRVTEDLTSPENDAHAGSNGDANAPEHDVPHVMRLIQLHLAALAHVVHDLPRDTPERVVAKLTVLEWRLERLGRTVSTLAPHPPT